MAIIGIDLGTTNSLGCVYKNGMARLVPNRDGGFLTPSAVSVLEDGSILVGKKAKDRRITHPESTAVSFKKDMGSDIKYTLGQYTFTPEELSAFVIQSILEDARNFIDEPITEAVISVPAYFHDKQRAATKRAGALAGIYVERIINEPSAAALAYYQEEKDEKNYLIFDFGGGTLDVSLVSCMENLVEIKAVAGNNHLGGDDFDTLIAQNFLKEHGLSQEEMTSIEYATLVKKARDCKVELSDEESASIKMVIHEKVFESLYTTKRLIKESASILNEVKNVVGNVLRDGKKKANQVDNIVMVGGSSKMPMMQSYLRHLFHKEAIVSSACDDMIAIGLGYFCGIKEKNADMKDWILTDVCPFSLGIAINNTHGKQYMSTIIARNSILPASKIDVFSTVYDMQKKINVRVYQGEEMYVDQNTYLGNMNIEVTPKPKGQENVFVRFSYDINGLLLVDVNVPSTGKSYSKVFSEVLDKEEIEKRRKELEKLRIDPRDLPENTELKETLQQLFVQSSPENKVILIQLMDIFEEAMLSESPLKLKKAIKKIKEVIKDFNGWDPLSFEEEQEDWDDPWADEDEFEEDEFSDLDIGAMS